LSSIAAPSGSRLIDVTCCTGVFGVRPRISASSRLASPPRTRVSARR